MNTEMTFLAKVFCDVDKSFHNRFPFWFLHVV
jgi:hypothetical protein